VRPIPSGLTQAFLLNGGWKLSPPGPSREKVFQPAHQKSSEVSPSRADGDAAFKVLIQHKGIEIRTRRAGVKPFLDPH